MYIGCRAVIISIFITFLLLCSPCFAENPYLDPMVTTHELVAEKTFNGFTTSWYYSPGLTNQEYIIAIQNLEDENRETNITSLISNTNFNLYEISNILFKEYKLIPYAYTVDHYDEIEHSEWNETNQTWVYWTEQVLNYTEIIESEQLDWKPCKMNTYSVNNVELKENYGNILIPKYNSKDKGDGTFNGTKIFKLIFNTPISNGQYGFGSSGMVALLLDENEYCPYWNITFSNRIEIIITTNGTSTPVDYQVKRNITYESEMQADFDDIRFTNSSGEEISYWIESKVDSNYANVWVNLSDAITHPGSDTVWMYYGNAGVSSASSGNDTFVQWHGVSTTNYLDSLLITPSNIIYETLATISTSDRDNRYGMSNNVDFAIDDSISLGPYHLDASNILYAPLTWNESIASYSTTTLSITGETRFKLTLLSGTLRSYVNDIEYGSALSSGIADENMGLGIQKAQALADPNQTWAFVRKGITNEPILSYGTEQFYTNSLHYNATSNYNHTIELDGTITSNRSIIATDDTNDTAQSTGNSYLIINTYDNSALKVRDFTFTGDNLDWYQVANISGTYDLKNVSGTIETQTNGNFTTNLIAGTYWVVAAATTTSYTVSGTIYGAAGLGEGQVTVILGSDSTTTPSSGSYSFTNIPTGTYTLTASKPGLQDASTTITVSSDTTQDLTMALATSPGGGGQQSSDWALPFNISTPISRLDGLFTSLQVPSDPGKINLFWYCIAGFGLFMFVDGTAFHFDKSRNNPVIKLKYRISAPLSLILMFLGLLYIGLINWNSAFFINTLDWLAHSSITQPAILGTGILLLGVFVFIDGTTFHFDKSRNNPVIKLKYRISAPLSLILIFIGLLYLEMINWNSVFFIRVFDWTAFSSITLAAMLGTIILLLGILAFIDGLAFYLDKSRKSTFLKIKYQVLITAGMGLCILGAVISKLLIFS